MKIQRTISEFIADRVPATLSPQATVADAVELMHQRSVDCVLVVDQAQRLVGIFTERDFLERVAAAGRVVASTRLHEVMTADPETLRPEDCVTYAINRMGIGGYRNVPIVSAAGRVIATLSVRDVIALLDLVFSELDDADEKAARPWTDIGGGG
jgi:CBS domain-containing protein